MATYAFGCVKVNGKDDWLVQNASKSTSSQEAMALNEVGEPVVDHFYQKVQEMSFEVIIPENESESNIPAVGDVFTYENKAWYVASSTLTQTNTDFHRYQLQCKRFVATNLPANA